MCSGSHQCNQFATCTNTFGTYECECEPGFLGNGKFCKRLDDRVEFDDASGAYVCPEGYRGGVFSCDDIDECSSDDACAPMADCHNTLGSYECVCKPGYSGKENCT